MKANADSVQSVSRVFDLVETLCASPQGLSLSALAAATGLHPSTAHRLLATMSSRGYVMKDSYTNRYHLTTRMFEVGGVATGTAQLLNMATPLLEELAFFTTEAVHFVKRLGSTVTYLYKAEPYQQLVRMASYVGCRNPMFCTGVGKSILALLPAEEVREIWNSSEIRAYTPKTITQLPMLMDELEQIRQQGYAIDDEEHESGVRCLAVAVCDWAEKPVAAISVSAPVFRMDEKRIDQIYPRMRAIAKEIGCYLGGIPKQT